VAGTSTRRVAAVGAATTVAATGLVALLGASQSGAAVVGSLTVSPASGADSTPLTVTTSAGCPSGGTNVVVRVLGNGFPANGQVVVGNTDAGVSQSQPFSVALSDTLKAFAAQQSPPATLSGTYTLSLRCQDVFGSSDFGDFTGQITFTSPTTYVSGTGPTAAPTTAAPTTAPPTARPTTAAPTTAPPTVAPTTAAPTTAPPTVTPTSARPTTAAPTTAPPAVTPTQAPAPGFALRISPEYVRVRPGTTVVLSTRLVRGDLSYVPERAVGFYTRPKGGATFVLSRRAVTDDEGLAYGVFRPTGDFRYFTNFNSSATTVGARSPFGLVQVATS
jgi:hypothetical protein